MPTEKCHFAGSQGELAAALDLPDSEIRAYALLAHCFTCSKDALGARRISDALTAHGIAVLRFDFTGLGSSEGDFSNSTFSSNIEDLVLAAEYLRKQGKAASLLIGHSLGGSAVLAAADRIPEATAIVTLAAPSDPSHIVNMFADHHEDILINGEVLVELAGRPFRITSHFLEDISEHHLLPKVARLQKALLVMHASTDDTVGIENAASIFIAAKHPKSFVSLDRADHLLTNRADAEYVAGVIAMWASRYLYPTRAA